MTAHEITEFPEPRRLSNGFWVEPDDAGRWTLARCRWLIERPSGNPEPDSPSDLYVIVDCGARITEFRHGGSSFTCEAGHHHESYVATEGRYEYECEMNERFEAGVR